MRNRMTLKRFAQIVGFNRANVKGFKQSLSHLEQNKAVKVKQGGFIAHSLHHPKIIYVYNWDLVKKHFGQGEAPRDAIPENNYEEISHEDEYSKSALSFCVSERACRYQWHSVRLPYYLCLATRKCKQRIGSRLPKKLVVEVIKDMKANPKYKEEANLFFNC